MEARSSLDLDLDLMPETVKPSIYDVTIETLTKSIVTIGFIYIYV